MGVLSKPLCSQRLDISECTNQTVFSISSPSVSSSHLAAAFCHKKLECSGRSSRKRGYQLASPSAACFHPASLPPNIQGDDYSLIRPTRVRGSGERAQRERVWGPVGLSSRPLIAVSHHAIDPPGSFRCQKRFHNSLIPTNLRDKLGGVESVNGAPRTWNPVAGSFFTSPPASFTAGILPLC
ncbi:hypothetical protein QQF64_010396 [Cirrhinus molitorella]|uniref:Uncharacterized protein n=1 Tax=Cirrhinus molitorella TaxID=172907 RepID=A0ABR3M3X6_9TELE